MKKTYIIPLSEAICLAAEEQVLNGSIKVVGGDAGITMGEGDAPGSADVKTTTVDWEKWD